MENQFAELFSVTGHNLGAFWGVDRNTCSTTADSACLFQATCQQDHGDNDIRSTVDNKRDRNGRNGSREASACGLGRYRSWVLLPVAGSSKRAC